MTKKQVFSISKLTIVINLCLFVGIGYFLFFGAKESIDYDAYKGAFTVESILSSASNQQVRTITVKEAKLLHKSADVLFMDARPHDAFLKHRIPSAVSVPYNTARTNSELDKMDKNQAIVAYCNSASCPMAEALITVLLEKGFQRVILFSGGIVEWRNASLPLVSG